MAKLANPKLIEAFVDGKTGNLENHGGSLYIAGDKLVNYQTVIAKREGENKILLNVDKYSVTTSKIQGQLRRAIPANWIVEVHHDDLN